MTPEETTTLVQSLQDNAERLGLTWEIRLATVTDNSPIRVRFDSDAGTSVDASGITSMIGSVYPGQRVYVVSVPPAGNYIIGEATTQLGLRARGTVASVPNATQTPLTFSTIDEESGADFASGTFSTIISPASGLWAVTARVSLFAAGGARNFVNIQVTSALTGAIPSYRANFSPGETLGVVSATFPLLAGDSFVTSVYQEGGANNCSTWISMFRVAPYGA